VLPFARSAIDIIQLLLHHAVSDRRLVTITGSFFPVAKQAAVVMGQLW